MSRRDRHDIGRFVASLALFAFVAIVIPVGLVAVSRSRFGSANPCGAGPPWRWFGDGPGSALGEPIGDDAVIDGLIRICLCVIWAAVTVIVVTTVLEVVHGVRHRGLAMPAVRGLGPVQRLARFIAVGIIVVLPVLTPAPSIASTIGRAPPTSSTHRHRPFPTGTHTERSFIQPLPRPDMTTHIVQPGESVYSIAERLAGGDGARVIDIADAIVEANLGATMSPGQRFTSPAYIEEGWALQVPAARWRRPPVEPVSRHLRGAARRHVVGHRRRPARRTDGLARDLGTQPWAGHGRGPHVRRPEPDPAGLGPGDHRSLVHHDDPPPAEPIVPTELLPPPDVSRPVPTSRRCRAPPTTTSAAPSDDDHQTSRRPPWRLHDRATTRTVGCTATTPTPVRRHRSGWSTPHCSLRASWRWSEFVAAGVCERRCPAIAYRRRARR